ncbi:MAG: alpha-amylase family glycosyl hydrolase [Candidatus Hodarchaeota archaeon]
MRLHQQMFEINARVWLYSLRRKLKRELTLLTIPDELWIKIIEKGFDWIWLMGVWKHSPLRQEELARHPGLIKEIALSLPNWDYTDIIGSPYSIVSYELNPQLGSQEDLKLLKCKLNQFGAKLMLDFVPNHFGNASELVLTNPEYFISIDTTPKEKSLFKQITTKKGVYWVAYGKDPYFPPWTDTFQLNYFNEDTRNYMIDILQNQIAPVCDGVRCDMAMLCLNDIISKTWGFYFQKQDGPSFEFWTDAIETLKSSFPEFTFLAEVYWDLGWKLQQLGFDYTYDKRLYDRLEQENVELIRGHLNADISYQRKSLRFIENHDEKRAINVFGRERSIAAAVIMGTIPGLSLYHQGQLKGEKIKIPVQLRQKQKELPDIKIQQAYESIFEFTNQEVIRRGQWSLLTTSTKNILAWQWYIPDSDKKISVVVVNYSSVRSQGRIFLEISNEFRDIEQMQLSDNLNGIITTKRMEDVFSGLYIDLQPFQCHLFNIKPI